MASFQQWESMTTSTKRVMLFEDVFSACIPIQSLLCRCAVFPDKRRRQKTYNKAVWTLLSTLCSWFGAFYTESSPKFFFQNFAILVLSEALKLPLSLEYFARENHQKRGSFWFLAEKWALTGLLVLRISWKICPQLRCLCVSLRLCKKMPNSWKKCQNRQPQRFTFQNSWCL